MGKLLAAIVAIVAMVPLYFTSACVIEGGVSVGTGVAVSGPPPAPMPEVRPPPPAPDASWIPGYWHWTGMQYAWIPGHWETGPRGLRWRPPRYSLHEGMYFYEPGGWAPAQP